MGKPTKATPRLMGRDDEVDPEASALAEEALANAPSYGLNTEPSPKGWKPGDPTTSDIFVKKTPDGQVVKPSSVPDDGVYTTGEPEPTKGGGTFLTANDERLSGLIAGQTAEDKVFNAQLHGGARGPGDVVQDEGENYLPFGGVEGKQRFNRAYDPSKLAKAFDDSSKAQGEKAEELKAHYEKQIADETQRMAVIKARRAEDSQQIEFQQKQLENKTRQYTDDLANQGKFWENPGNIISAISFSLMPIFSNDPAIGVKLINQAIDRDMNNRRNLADMHLGELRSNIGTYRKMAEDRQAGDMLAQAEAHRVAVLDVERISQKFASPIAKAQAEAIIQDQAMRYEQLRGQAFARIHNDPRRMDPRIRAGFAKGVEGAWSPYGTNPAPTIPKGSPGSAVQGSYDGTATTASTTGKSLTPQQSAILSDPKQTVKAVLDGRVPQGEDVGDFLQKSIERQAKAMSGFRDDVSTPEKATLFEQKKAELREKAKKEMDPATSAMMVKNAQERNGTEQLQRDLDIIGRSEKDPNKFIGMIRNWAPEKMVNWYNSIKLKAQNEPGNPAVAREQAKFEAANRLHQLFMMGVVDYYHSKAGANQSPGEEGRLSQIIKSDAAYQEMVGFVHARSSQLNADEKAALSGLSPAALYLYMQKRGVGKIAGPLDTEGVAAPQPQPFGQVRPNVSMPPAPEAPQVPRGALPPPPEAPEVPVPPVDFAVPPMQPGSFGIRGLRGR